MNPHDHRKIEEFWKAKWEKDSIYKTDIDSKKKKLYILVEFPYPSGDGLHVGHVRSYTAMDIVARKKRIEGYEVLFPIGWDAFGLPAENYAIKTGIHPRITTKENIDNFRRQLKACGFSFDWDREISTIDPNYYRWTQWIFLKLYEKDLAYKKEMPVNWCPNDLCVLANEEVVDGECERCGTKVEKKNKEQWMLAITKYAERLDKDLDGTDYLEKIKIQQRNWIGLSDGSEIKFGLVASDFESTFNVFTTRADTLFGCTYCVFAPEHPLVKELLEKNSIKNKEEVNKYIKNAIDKTDIDRSATGKEKTGVKLEGIIAVNPANKEEVPVFIADYVLPQYGTGVIMAVPAHDERDLEFAKKYNLEIKEVISPETGTKQKDPEFRKSIVAILFDKKQNKFLSINWGKSLGGNLFVGGGLDDGEDVISCAQREISEETGYINIKYISQTQVIHHNYFAHSKNVGRRIEATGLLFELVDSTKIKQSLEENEKNKFTIEWLGTEEIKSKVKDELHSLVYLMLIKEQVYIGEGSLINSKEFDGLDSKTGRIKITESVGGKIVRKSKLRDWVFARQRYWGEPVPIVYDNLGKMYPVAESELPVMLPELEKFEPTKDGKSPLSQVKDWVNIKGKIENGHFISNKNGEEFKRETDTMPQWAGSSWYFMRYIDPHNEREIGRKDLFKKWLPVDWYNGGMEHTTLHLLYSRFWYKFLFDIGVVSNSEPYYKRTSQGMILGKGGQKMSKSLGNVITPDEIIKEYGADVLRLYEMFIGPFDQAVIWDEKAIIGVERFLDKVQKVREKIVDDKKSIPIIHKTIVKITEGIEEMTFNTCVSHLMICINEFEKNKTISRDDYKIFLQLLSPFAPFLTEEIWKNLGEDNSIHLSNWPKEDEGLLVEKEITLAVQINGKLRDTIKVENGSTEGDVLEKAKELSSYKKHIGENVVKKVIFVKDKLINIVI